MKARLIVGLLWSAVSLAIAEWQAAKPLMPPDTSTPYMYAMCTGADGSGHPWAIWGRLRHSYVDQFYEASYWNGTRWDDPTRLPDTIAKCLRSSYADFIFDEESRLFLIYPTQDDGNHCDIHSIRYDSATQQWELPCRVNDPDTTILDEFCPRISVAGGETWAAWFDENGDSVICNIKAGHWDQTAGC